MFVSKLALVSILTFRNKSIDLLVLYEIFNFLTIFFIVKKEKKKKKKKKEERRERKMKKNVQDTFRSVNGFVATTTLTPFSRRL